MIRAIALMTTAALAAVFIWSCEKGNVDGYTWYRQSEPSKDYDWFVVPQHEVDMACDAHPGEHFNGCAFQLTTGFCHVYSIYTEAAARKFTPSGPLGRTTLFEHEVWNEDRTLGHCAGFNHKERHIRAIQGGP